MVVCRPSTLVCTQLCSLASLAASHSPYPFSTSTSVFYLLLSLFVPSLPLLSSSLLPRGKTIFLLFSLRCPFLSLLSLLSCTLASRVPSPSHAAAFLSHFRVTRRSCGLARAREIFYLHPCAFS